MDREERRRRIAQHPNAVRHEAICQLLEDYGWTLDRIRGSHYIYACGDQMLSVPFRRPHVLPIYVKSALAATEEPCGPKEGEDHGRA